MNASPIKTLSLWQRVKLALKLILGKDHLHLFGWGALSKESSLEVPTGALLLPQNYNYLQEHILISKEGSEDLDALLLVDMKASLHYFLESLHQLNVNLSAGRISVFAKNFDMLVKVLSEKHPDFFQKIQESAFTYPDLLLEQMKTSIKLSATDSIKQSQDLLIQWFNIVSEKSHIQEMSLGAPQKSSLYGLKVQCYYVYESLLRSFPTYGFDCLGVLSALTKTGVVQEHIAHFGLGGLYKFFELLSPVLLHPAYLRMPDLEISDPWLAVNESQFDVFFESVSELPINWLYAIEPGVAARFVETEGIGWAKEYANVRYKSAEYQSFGWTPLDLLAVNAMQFQYLHLRLSVPKGFSIINMKSKLLPKVQSVIQMFEHQHESRILEQEIKQNREDKGLTEEILPKEPVLSEGQPLRDTQKVKRL